MLAEKRQQFPENIHTFNTQSSIPEGSEADCESTREDVEISKNERDTTDNVATGPCSVNEFWVEEVGKLNRQTLFKKKTVTVTNTICQIFLTTLLRTIFYHVSFGQICFVVI